MNENTNKLLKLFNERAPIIEITEHNNYYRHHVINNISGCDRIGIELGVAGGSFSKRMIDSGKFKKFFGVDLYEDHHNVKEYKHALTSIGMDSNYVLLRMSFDDAIDLFNDNYFDFIYFDGYAHTGEEGGKTFSDWYKKLKVGGIFAGDDYHDDWPLVKWAVNDFVHKVDGELHVTGLVENTGLNRYPSWFIEKKEDKTVAPNEELLKLGLEIRKATRKVSNEKTIMQQTDIIDIVNKIKLSHPDFVRNLKALL